MTQEDERREALIGFIKEKWHWFIYAIVAVIIWIGVKIRVSNLSLLTDVTNGKLLTIELDTHLFYRYAQTIVEQGALPLNDVLRNVPFGYNPYTERILVSYFSAYFYKIVHFFNPAFSLDKATVYQPVIIFIPAMVIFFLLVRRLFNSHIAALATAFLTFIPPYLHRTILGFSDKESLGLLFFYLSLYFFVVGWQKKEVWASILFGALSGFGAVFMTFAWGGSKFIYLIIGSFVIIESFLDKLDKKDILQYTAWFIAFLSLPLFRPELMDVTGLFTSATTAILTLAFVLIWIDYLLFEKNVFHIKQRLETIAPKGVMSLMITVVFGLIILTAVIGPSETANKILKVYTDFTTPFGQDRWQLTVAENHQPYITSWLGQMGGPLFMVLYLFGAILLFYEMFSPIDAQLSEFKHTIVTILGVISLSSFAAFLYYFKSASPLISIAVGSALALYSYILYKKGFDLRATLTAFFLSFVLFFIFSRYDPSSVFDGNNFLSRSLYLGSLLIFGLGIALVYFTLYYTNRSLYDSIKNIDKKYLFITIIFVFLIVGARGAARLVMLLAIIASILAAYASIRPIEYVYSKNKSIAYKVIVPLLILILLVSPVAIGNLGKGSLLSFYEQTSEQAKYSGPPYNQQWQYAGKWIRENTPMDSIFIHWWDYGYWVQTGGQRATVTDGGNNIGSWNYQIGRHVLTAENATEALEVIAAHNATHLLIIADEIGKYTAYSSIGSDINYDRFSWINTFTLNPQFTKETRNGTTFVFTGGTGIDEDFVLNGKLYPAQAAGIGGFFLPIEKTETEELLLQPKAMIVYSGQQTEVNLKCVYLNGKTYQFPGDLPGCLRLVPTYQNGKVNPIGGALWVSGRGVRALWTQLFLFEQNLPGMEHPMFKKVYDDSDRMPLAIVNGRLIGPLKIWNVELPSDFVLSEEKYKLYTRYEHENPEARTIGKRFS